MQFLPKFDDEKRSIFFTVLICAVLGISFVLFVVSYKNLKAENNQLKEQAQNNTNLAPVEKNNLKKESTQESLLQSRTKTIELIDKVTKTSQSPTTPPSQPTVTPTPTATPTPIPFITAATLSIEPSNGDVCGTNFKFRGYITSSGQGVVSYRWKRTDAENVTSEPYPTVTFENAGTKEINYYLTLTHNADSEGWFEITAPGSVASNRARYVQQNC